MKNLTSRRFNRLIAVKDAGSLRSRRTWECICDCGNSVRVLSSHLLNGNTQSCGCLRKESARITGQTVNTKHGLDGTGVYRSWIAMIHRCYDSTTSNYRDYGGRGIKVCKWLRVSPLCLKELLGHRPEGLSLNRIKNNLHYSCGNCSECARNGWHRNVEWATRLEQNRNSRNCVYIQSRGETKCAAEWSDITGIPVGTIIWRYKRGWTSDRLFSVGQCRL